MRHGRRCMGALLLAGMAWRSVVAAEGGGPPANSAWRRDAWLWDVAFVDAKRGWAVGDRGAIWHTADGGKTWRGQESGVETPLLSVHFLDAQNGWAVGGHAIPLTLESVGLVLRTRDGGRTWDRDVPPPLSALARVGFSDAANGWAIGLAGLFPSGVFLTDNGGRNWDPLPGMASQAWRTGDFLNPQTGALAGVNGALVAVKEGKLVEAKAPTLGLREVRRIELAPDGSGWLAGDGGLVLNTRDGGQNWQAPAAPLPEGMEAGFDGRALALHGGHCWIAGSPGSVVLHSADGGRSWDVARTGQSLPLSALAFVDERHGWAVGALGAILLTEDGGRTWQPVRAGGTRAAMAGFFLEAQDVPLELFARVAGNDGYLSVVQVLGRSETERPHEPPLDRRTHAAAVAVGACGAEAAWGFPIRPQGLRLPSAQVLAGWDRALGEGGLAHLESHIVRQLRTWRPDVVVTRGLDPPDADTAAGLVGQAVLRGVEAAADAERFPELTEDLGLPPWQVKKVYCVLPKGALGTVSVTTAQIAPRLGRSLAEQAALPRALVSGRFEASPESIGFRLVQDALPQDTGHGDLFSGVSLPPGCEARRPVDESAVGGLDAARRSAQWHRNLQAILARSQDGPGAGLAWAAQLDALLAGLDETQAGLVMFTLGQRYHDGGRWTEAADVFGMLAERLPDHPLTGAALVWLVQHWSSGEAAWRRQAGERIARQKGRFGPVDGAAVSEPGPRTASFELEAGENGDAAVDAPSPAQQAGRATVLGKLIERARPSLYAAPTVRFPLAGSLRAQGQDRQAERAYLALRRGCSDDCWRRCAEGERWLTARTGPAPKAIAHCPEVDSPPRLDGELNDAIWQSAAACELRSPLRDDVAWPAVALIARDGEFLYLAAHCRKAAGTRHEAASGTRTRDTDLASQDRVEFLLDVDRDFATGYHFSIDHRGWTGEDCWGDRTWDPNWYVAAGADEGSWTVEAAIPLEELSGAPRTGEAWAISIHRTAPGAGFQSWTPTTDGEVRPEAGGYLLFGTDGDRGQSDGPQQATQP